MFVVIFGMILKVDRGMDNFVGFLIIGVIFFSFITKGLGAGSGLIQRSRNMITSFQFPRAALAFSTTLRAFLDHIAPAFMATLLAVLTQLDKSVHWTIVFVIPLYFLIHFFALGLTMIVARITAFIPDAKSLVTLLQRALFFLSGVFFPLARFETHPPLQAVMEANPVYQFLTAVRLCVLDGEIPSVGTWASLAAWSLGTAVVGLIFFWQAEARYSSVH